MVTSETTIQCYTKQYKEGTDKASKLKTPSLTPVVSFIATAGGGELFTVFINSDVHLFPTGSTCWYI